MADTELFTTVFAAKIKAIEPTENEIQEAKASINALKGLLPADINPEEDPDLLYVAANLAIAGVVNLNDDGLDIPTALKVYKKFEKKQVNIEHNRKQICGYIIHAGLSEIGTDRIITEEEARALNKPFNISTVAVLWKVANKELCKYIVEASNPAHSDYNTLSLSFEMGFRQYYIASIPDGEVDIAKASKIVTVDDDEFTSYSKHLRAYKGNGISPFNKEEKLYRIMPDNVIPLGQGIVTVPAAAVKGITVISEQVKTQEPEAKTEAQPTIPSQDIEKENERVRASVEETKKALLALIDAIDKKDIENIIFSKNSVLPFTDIKSSHKNNMNKDLQKIKDQVANMEKPEEFKQAFANVSVLADAIATESERLAKELETEKNRASEFEKAKTEVQAANLKLTADLADLKRQFDEIKAEQMQAAIAAKFNERMSALDEEFVLDDDTRALLVEDVKNCADDAAFAKLVEKNKKLMKEKTKSYVEAKASEEKRKNDELATALASKGLKAVVKEDKVNFEEIIAAAQANVVSAPIDNVVQVQNTASIKDRAVAAFADVEIGGKKVSERNK